MAKAASLKIQREPMSRVDTAWLRMERATNLMMITGVMMFDTPMSLDALKKVIKQKFLAYRRFGQKAVDTQSTVYWETDADFDLDWHVRLTALPGKAGKRELERFVSSLASTPLDQTKPLWQFHLVESYQGGSALIARIHHCYADGIALVQVLLSLTDTTAEAGKGSDLESVWLKDEKPSGKGKGGFERYRKIGSQVLAKGMELYNDPSLAAVIANEGREIARELLNA